jgi:hypothetical protein
MISSIQSVNKTFVVDDKRSLDPECLRTARFHRPITDLPSIPRYSQSKDVHAESRPTLLKGERVKIKFLSLIYYMRELRRY